MSHDEISNPKHYDLFSDGMQAIDVIRAALTQEEFAGYCKGNFLKYRLRAGEKGDPVKCLGKAEWYRAELREHHANTLATNCAEKPLEDAQNAASTVAMDRYSELLNSFEHHARKLTHWKHCMSGNDSYFGEPAGLVKQIAYELDRLIGKKRTAEKPAVWPNEQRRQDSEAEDEAWKAAEARMDVIGQNGNGGEHYAERPDWKDAPRWALWLAQDASGRWTWYEYKPLIDDDHGKWLVRVINARVSRSGGGAFTAPDANWRETLEGRR